MGTLLLIPHFLLVKRHGISSLPSEADAAVDGGPAPERTGSTFAAHLVRMAGFGLVLLAASLALAAVVPAPLGARPIPGTETTKPPWMFLVFYPFEDWFGLPALIWVPAVLFTALAALPFVDRSPYRSPRRRRLVIALGALAAVAAVLLVVYALVTVPVAHVQGAMG